VGVTDAFLPDKFQYDPASDTYTCPEGKRLTARNGHDRPGQRLVRYIQQWIRLRWRPCFEEIRT
jgi:hypothetical protein